MSGTLLIGYDVEGLIEGSRWVRAYSDPESVTQVFLARVEEVHYRYKVPCTLFVLGQVLEKNVGHFQKLNGNSMFDIQQHTYSHIRLKTIVQECNNPGKVFKGGVKVFKADALQDIAKDVRKASSLLKRYLNVNCLGLAGPNGYYRGLSDKPEVLQILQDVGIRFIRTYARNEHDWQPVSLDTQPFWYKPQGFPEILELPAQDWQDCIYREIHGWKNTEGYLSHLKLSLDYVVTHDLTWSVCFHDFASIRDDPKMDIICGLIDYARKKHVRIMSCEEYYQENK